MYFLWTLFVFIGLARGDIFANFEKIEGTVCEKNNGSSYGNAHGKEEGCALMCLLYDKCTTSASQVWDRCTAISLTDHATESCRVLDACVPAAGENGTTYIVTNSTDGSNWVQVEYPVPGMERFDRLLSSGHDNGAMWGMAEDVCVLHCLLTDCPAATWSVDGTCTYKSAAAVTASDDYTEEELYTHVRTVTAGCIHGYSCYALLTHQNGQSRQTAHEQCVQVGGHLVEFNSYEERDAVMADGRFGVVWGPLWLGIKYTGGQWVGDVSGMIYDDLPWADGQPASTNEGQAAFVNPRYGWTFKTSSDNNPKTNPFCELFFAITMTTTGRMMQELNDGDINTCFKPARPAEAAGTTLKTSNLSPASANKYLVKVHGDGLVCMKNTTNNNIRVWQELKKKSNNGIYNINNSGSGWSSHMTTCDVTGSYMWHGKPLCLYMCQCDEKRDCSVAYVRMDYTASVTICELQVL